MIFNLIEYSSQVNSNKGTEMIWSAWALCESLAYQKGFRNRKGDLDIHRAANLILRDVLDGNVTFFFIPPK